MPDWSGYSEQIEIRRFGRISWSEKRNLTPFVGAAIKVDYRILNGLTWRTGEVVREVGRRTAERLLEYLKERMRTTPRGILYYIVPSVRRNSFTWIRAGTGRKRPPNSRLHWASPPGYPPAVFSGNLLQSGRVITNADKQREGRYIHYAAFEADYAKALEFGTPILLARPMVRESIRYWATRLSAQVIREVRDELRNETKAELQHR